MALEYSWNPPAYKPGEKVIYCTDSFKMVPVIVHEVTTSYGRNGVAVHRYRCRKNARRHNIWVGEWELKRSIDADV